MPSGRMPRCESPRYSTGMPCARHVAMARVCVTECQPAMSATSGRVSISASPISGTSRPENDSLSNRSAGSAVADDARAVAVEERRIPHERPLELDGLLRRRRPRRIQHGEIDRAALLRDVAEPRRVVLTGCVSTTSAGCGSCVGARGGDHTAEDVSQPARQRARRHLGRTRRSTARVVHRALEEIASAADSSSTRSPTGRIAE